MQVQRSRSAWAARRRITTWTPPPGLRRPVKWTTSDRLPRTRRRRPASRPHPRTSVGPTRHGTVSRPVADGTRARRVADECRRTTVATRSRVAGRHDEHPSRPAAGACQADPRRQSAGPAPSPRAQPRGKPSARLGSTKMSAMRSGRRRMSTSPTQSTGPLGRTGGGRPTQRHWRRGGVRPQSTPHGQRRRRLSVDRRPRRRPRPGCDSEDLGT